MIDLLKSDINDFAVVKSILNGVEVRETDINQLLIVLSQSSNLLVTNMIAFRLKQFKDSRILEVLIEVISRPENLNKRAKLIYCCDEYDCTKYFKLFMQLVLEEDGESCINSIDIISEMKGPFSNGQLSNAVDKIEAYIDINKNNDKIPYLRKLKKHLKKLL